MSDKNDKLNITQEVNKRIQEIVEEQKIIPPEKEYENIKDDSIPGNPKLNYTRRESRSSKTPITIIIFILSAVLFLLLALAFISVSNQKDNTINQNISTEYNDVVFTIAEKGTENDLSYLVLNFDNKSIDTIYFSVYGLTVKADDQTLYPKEFSKNAPLSFFGKGFDPNTSDSIKIFFDENLEDYDNLTLNIFNVSNTKHRIWDIYIKDI